MKNIKTYIISYDIKSTNNRDYMPLYQAIKDINFDNPWQHFAESSWLIRTNLTAQEIFDKLFTVLGEDNLIFISELNIDNLAGWLGKPTWEWIKNTNNEKGV